MQSGCGRILRSVAAIVLAFFTWSFGGIFDVAYAAKSSVGSQGAGTKASAKKTKEQSSAEKFQKTVEEIEQIVGDMKGKKDTETDAERGKLRKRKAVIETLDTDIKKQFAETEKKLKDEGLPAEILNRHYRFVRHYEDNLKELKRNLDSIDKAKDRQELDTKAEETKNFLEKVRPPKRHKPLDPNKLPHRSAEPVFKEPRTSPEQFEKETEGKAMAQRQIPLNPPLLKGDTRHALAMQSPTLANGGRGDTRLALDMQSPTLAKGGKGGFSNKPVLVASNGPLTGLLSSNTQVDASLRAEGEAISPNIVLAASTPPTAADLAQTIEVQFTPAITAKAAELGNNPVKIYNWVRNNIEYVPTYGSIQGADMCLQTKQCNDFDTASLLIALLRASGISARYVYGTIELPIEKVMNWVGGFTDPMAALNFIASGGIPVKGLTSGGKIVKVQMEHVWVEAWIDYIPSRGARHRAGQEDTWIPLDASCKEHDIKQGINLSAAVPFDSAPLLSSLISSATINDTEGWMTGIDGTLVTTAISDYRKQIEAYFSQNNQNATVADIVGTNLIIKQEFPILAGTLPYKTVVIGAHYQELPDTTRHKLIFKVENRDIYGDDKPLNVTYCLPQIAGKKITLSYSPASAADEAVINSYLPKPHADGSPMRLAELPASLPAYLINLKSELMIDGQTVATGNTVTMGSTENFYMTFVDPAHGSDIVSNTIVAGDYWGIGVGVSKVSREVMKVIEDRLILAKTKVEANNFTGLTKDNILGEMLYTTAMLYNARMDGHDEVLAHSLGVKAVRFPSEAIFKSVLKVENVFGIPVSASTGGLMMDVDRNLSLVKAFDGDKSKKIEFMRYSGINSSAFEHRVPEQLFIMPGVSVEGISAVKALQIANDTKMPIYTVTRDNIDTILPQLQIDVAVIADIRNAVNVGKEVIVSKTDITFNGWTGVGYIITDPLTGTGAYMISGGQSGAYIAIMMAGVITANPLVIAAGLALLYKGLFTWVGEDFADFVGFAGIGVTYPKDWCGSEGTEWVPDYPFGIDSQQACENHDYCYKIAATPVDKLTCDGMLGIDIYTDCIGQGRQVFLCEFVSDTYTFFVTVFGWKAWRDAK